jgi:hypothetical protein
MNKDSILLIGKGMIWIKFWLVLVDSIYMYMFY